MAKYLIDLSAAARYAGVDTDITKIADGDAASASTFNAPPQDLRLRMETLRQEVEDLKYVADADRAMVLAIEGTLTANYASNQFSLSMGTNEYLLIRPFVSTTGALGEGTLSISSTPKLTLSIANDAEAPKAWGQYDGAWGPATRGANAIKVTFQLKTSGTGVSVAEGAKPYELVVSVPAGSTVDAIVTAIEVAQAATDLHLIPEAVTGQGSSPITLTEGSPQVVYIEGAADAEAHKITAAALSDFFTDAGNKLTDGDTLAIWYDQLVDAENGEGGRRQQLVDSTLNSAMLFNTRLNPERIPGCIPVATVVGTKLFLIDGTVMTDGESIGGSGTEYLPTAGGTVSGNLIVQGSTTLGDGGTGDDVLVRGDGNTLAVGGSLSTIGDAPFRVTSAGAVTAASISNGSSTLSVGTAGQDTAVQGNLTVAGATTLGDGGASDDVLIKGSGDTFGVGGSGTDNVAAAPFRVTSAGVVFAVDENVSGKFSVGASNYNDAPVKIIDSGVTTPAVTAGAATLNVSEDGQTTAVLGDLDVAGTIQTATSLTLSTQAAGDGLLTVYQNTANATAIEVKNGATSKFKVDAEGDVTATALTLSGVSVPPPGNFQSLFTSGTWTVSSTNGGTANILAVTATAGTYLATVAVSLNTNGGSAGETDWCLLTEAEYTANDTRQPSQHATAGTAPYVNIHMTNGESSTLALTRVLTITTNSYLRALGYISSGAGNYLVRGSLTLIRIA